MSNHATVEFDNAAEIAEAVRTSRQARLYADEKVPQDVVDTLLEIARWSGSARNTQPWHFIVIDDKNVLKQISELRQPINWVADAPLAIGMVMDGKAPMSEAYDEGRVTERLLLAARVLGLGGGIAWFGDEAQTAEGKRILGVPDDRNCQSVVVIGFPTSLKDTRPNANIPGRNPMSEITSYNTFGAPYVK